MRGITGMEVSAENASATLCADIRPATFPLAMDSSIGRARSW